MRFLASLEMTKVTSRERSDSVACSTPRVARNEVRRVAARAQCTTLAPRRGEALTAIGAERRRPYFFFFTSAVGGAFLAPLGGGGGSVAAASAGSAAGSVAVGGAAPASAVARAWSRSRKRGSGDWRASPGARKPS